MLAAAGNVREMWSATAFGESGLDSYAEQQMLVYSRFGVQAMAVIAGIAQLCIAAISFVNDGSAAITYTSVLLMFLSAHIVLSACYVDNLDSLHMLGIAFLVINAVAITVLAHRAGELNIGTIAATVMLLVAVPLVPWALREASIVIGLTYGLQTISLYSVPGRFDAEALVVLQLLILGSAAIVIVVVGRNTYARREEIRARFELERTHRKVELLSMQDHLTGAWNRRYLDENFGEFVTRCRNTGRPLQLAILDIDDFKTINDKLGHQIGDRLLVLVAHEFSTLIDDDGCLVRLGGDEFEILYCGAELRPLIDRAIVGLRRRVATIGIGDDIEINLSAGIATADLADAVDHDALYRQADRALYGEKRGERISGDSRMAPALAMSGRWRL